MCDSCEPCDMLRRTTDMPASARRKKDSRSQEVGPMVHTTLVFLQAGTGCRARVQAQGAWLRAG